MKSAQNVFASLLYFWCISTAVNFHTNDSIVSLLTISYITCASSCLESGITWWNKNWDKSSEFNHWGWELPITGGSANPMMRNEGWMHKIPLKWKKESKVGAVLVVSAIECSFSMKYHQEYWLHLRGYSHPHLTWRPFLHQTSCCPLWSFDISHGATALFHRTEIAPFHW